ncbi:MAG: hypothetical protein ACYSWP_03565 [Planctomycetota bacterium]
MKRILLVWAVILAGTQVFGGTLLVPSGGYTTIQTAINDANNGDTIIVAQGTYFENIDFSGKAITLRSSDPNDSDVVDATIIDGSCPNDPNFASVVTFITGEGPNSVLSGFTIRRGTGQSDPCGASWYWKGTDGGGVFCRPGKSPNFRKHLPRQLRRLVRRRCFRKTKLLTDNCKQHLQIKQMPTSRRSNIPRRPVLFKGNRQLD